MPSMMGSWRLTGKPQQDHYHGFPGKNTKGHFKAGNNSYLGFRQKSAALGYQLVSSRYSADKSHTNHTVHYASCHATTLAIHPVLNVDKYILHTVLPDLAKEDLKSVEFMTRWNRF